MSEVEKQLSILQEGIRQDAPLVADFFDVLTPLSKYASSIKEYTAHQIHLERQKEFKVVVRTVLEKFFTAHEIAQGNIQWDGSWKINIVDHHGVLNHPMLVATNLIAQLDNIVLGKPEGIVVLTDSGVPLNNYFHKRGVKFAGTQINIFPARDRHVISYAAPFVKNFNLTRPIEGVEWTTEQQTFLARIEKEWNTIGDLKPVNDFAGQVSRINYVLWKQLFASEMRAQVSDLFCIPNETVAVELLKRHLNRCDSIFFKLLCDTFTREYFLKTFEGVTGCWDKKRNRGSHFFWALNEHGEAVTMHVEGTNLQTVDGSYSVALEPEALIQSMDAKKIYPSMFLVYGLATFYYGIRPLVGYGSMNYQTAMKNKWVEVMRTIDIAEAERIEHIPTNGFIGGLKTNFSVDQMGKFVDMYALDIIYRGGMTQEYLQALARMPFTSVLTPALIDIYDSYVRPEHKQPITITSNDLMGEVFDWIKKI